MRKTKIFLLILFFISAANTFFAQKHDFRPYLSNGQKNFSPKSVNNPDIRSNPLPPAWGFNHFRQFRSDAEWQQYLPTEKEIKYGINNYFLADTSGNAYVFLSVGTYYKGYNAFVFKYDPTGTLLWKKELVTDMDVPGLWHIPGAVQAKNGDIWDVLTDHSITHKLCVFSSDGNVKNIYSLEPYSPESFFFSTYSFFLFPENNTVFGVYSKYSYSDEKENYAIVKYDISQNTISDILEIDIPSYSNLFIEANPRDGITTFINGDSLTIAQYDKNFNIMFTKKISPDNGIQQKFRYDNENNLILSWLDQEETKLAVVKLDTLGNTIWSRSISFSDWSPLPNHFLGINKYNQIFTGVENQLRILTSDGQLTTVTEKPNEIYDDSFFPYGDGMLIFNGILIDRNGEFKINLNQNLYPNGEKLAGLNDTSFTNYSPDGEEQETISIDLPAIPYSTVVRSFYDEEGNNYTLNNQKELIKTDVNGNILFIKSISYELTPKYFLKLGADRNLLITTDFNQTILYYLLDDNGNILSVNKKVFENENLWRVSGFSYFAKGKKTVYVLWQIFNVDDNAWLFHALDFDNNFLAEYKYNYETGYLFSITEPTVDGEDNLITVQSDGEKSEILSWRPNAAPETRPINFDSDNPVFFRIEAKDNLGNFYGFLRLSTQEELYRLIKIDRNGAVKTFLDSIAPKNHLFIGRASIIVLQDNSVVAKLEPMKNDSLEIYHFYYNGEILHHYKMAGTEDFSYFDLWNTKETDKIILYNQGFVIGNTVRLKLFNLLTGQVEAEKIQTDSLGRSFYMEAMSMPSPGIILLSGNWQSGYGTGTLLRFDFESVKEENDNSKTTFSLQGNYPNPFNGQTTIRYYIKNPGEVEITIYNTLGQKIENWKGPVSAGNNVYRVKNRSLASGVYFYSVAYKGKILTGKMVYVK